MTRLKKFLIPALASILLLAASACQNPKQAAFVTASSFNSVADSAIGLYDEYRHDHQVSADLQQKIFSAVSVYRDAKNSVLSAVKAGGTPDSSSLQKAEASVLALIATVDPKLVPTQP